ncbi:MAG: PDZ domain-containing protein [Coriobacteriia bacterium]|nr:PDZ domain-containing protein [Coriobacteriia bacterium]
MSDENLQPGVPAEQPPTPAPAPPSEPPVYAPESAPPQPAPPFAAPPAPEAVPPMPPAPTAPPVAAAQPQPPHSHGNGAAIVTLSIVAALVMGAIAGVGGGILGSQVFAQKTGDGTQTVKVVPQTTDEPVIAASAAAVPSIVNLDVTSKAVSEGEGGLPQSHPSVPQGGNGSGVAFRKVDSGGTYILTNNHVVEDATKITVADSSGKKYQGTLVGRDPDTDIAVVRIAEELPVIETGDSTRLMVGQTVVAIGSPFGFEHSVTSGVVSALGRSLSNYGNSASAGYSLADVIQTDAAINPGNSGGALVDKSGRLVGINTAIYSDTGQSGGIGFAIPVSTASRVADELIAGGKVGHPFIGLIGLTLDPEMAAKEKTSVEQGALVDSLTKGAGADKAGVRVGDVVTKVDGKDIRSMDELVIAVRRHAIGDTVKLTVMRGTETLELDVVVGDKPGDFSMPSTDTTSSSGD